MLNVVMIEQPHEILAGSTLKKLKNVDEMY
jgi:hypothetical protein